MFIDRSGITPLDYICMLYVLNAAEEAGYSIKVTEIIDNLKHLMTAKETSSCLSELGDKLLILYVDENQKATNKLIPNGGVELGYRGVAFLVNYANEYIAEIQQQYGELPEKLIATLVPLLDLSIAPAADRHVKTTDNLPAFKELEIQLERIKLEIQKDLNADEMPIPNKKAIISDIDGMLTQIKDGYVRLSDLTVRTRPLVKNLAEWCKDFAVIAGAAGAAWLAIQSILKSLF